MKNAVLVTGASSGIGAATALEFSNNGYFVYLMGRNREQLERVAQQCRSGASIVSCDLRDSTGLNKRLDEILNTKIHQITTVVNNAGIYQTHTTEEGDDDIWKGLFETNLLGHVRIARRFFPYFKKNGGGSFINVSSTLGLRPTSNTSAYSAMKAAMINWTESLALEGGPFQIRANCICPGIVDTPIHSFHLLKTEEKNASLEKLASLQPLGRIGRPDEIAKAIYFLSSNQSSWTTGAVLPVDGGINLK
jgi:NAD(P)-dependent dehydrogenase (short-subunit alcohol dehydrogenase family)